MIYPNGHIDISQLLMMIESPEYAVYFAFIIHQIKNY